MEGTVRTQGTQIFFVDNSGSSSEPTIVRMSCPTGVTGLFGGTADKIDVTCLEYTGKFRQYEFGLGDASDVTIPFILRPGDVSQQTLFDLQRSRAVIEWMVCDEWGTTAPTLDSNDEMVPPADRNSYTLRAAVTNLQLDAAGNEVWRGTLTLTPSGDTTETWKTPE